MRKVYVFQIKMQHLNQWRNMGIFSSKKRALKMQVKYSFLQTRILWKKLNPNHLEPIEIEEHIRDQGEINE